MPKRSSGDRSLNQMQALFWGLCWLHEVPVETTRTHADSAEHQGLWYRPDFHVVVHGFLDTYVEISDGEDEGQLRALRSAWREALGQRLIVLYREHMHDLREARNTAQFTARLNLIGSGRL